MSRHWTDTELNMLKLLWNNATPEVIESSFPDRSWDSIRKKAKRELTVEKVKQPKVRVNSKLLAAIEAIKEGRTPDKKQADELAGVLEMHGMSILRRDTQKELAKTPPVDIKLKRWDGDTYAFGLISCSHLGSKHQQLTALNEFYDLLQSRGIDTVLHAGDLVEGSVHMHRDAPYHQFRHGADEQRDYAIANYPVRKGIQTQIISGNHDISFVNESGFNIVRAVCSQREDMTYCGDWIADMNLPGDFHVRLRHGRGGGAYAKSYKLQQIIGSLDLHDDPPDLYAVGHWHTAIWLPNCQGVSAFLLAAFQGMTPFAKSLTRVAKSVVGGWIITYQVDPRGGYLPASIKGEFIEFPEIHNDY